MVSVDSDLTTSNKQVPPLLECLENSQQLELMHRVVGLCIIMLSRKESLS